MNDATFKLLTAAPPLPDVVLKQIEADLRRLELDASVA
jgi:hypothetical protein